MPFNVLWAESCQHMATGSEREHFWDLLANISTGSSSWSASGGRFADAYWEVNGYRSQKRVSDAGVTEFYFSGWFSFNTAGSSARTPRWRFFEGSTLHCWVEVRDDDNTIEFYHGDGTLLADSGAFAVSTVLGEWHHLEMHIVIDDSAGSIELRVKEPSEAAPVTRISASGLDTRNGGVSGVVDTVELYAGASSGVRSQLRSQHLVFQGPGGQFLGEHRMRVVLPDADSVVQWTAQGGGDNYVEVDDDQYDADTTYVESATVSNRDRLALPDPGFVGQAAAVVVTAMARKDDPGSTKLKLGLRESGGSEDLSAAQAVHTDAVEYRPVWHVSHENPATTDPWTAAEIAAAESIHEVSA